MSHLPITSLVIVADKLRAPIGHSCITKAQDDPIYEADIWKDGFLSFSRTLRYISISREVPNDAYIVNVLTDVSVVGEREVPPPGFIPVEYTADTREKALRKKVLCVRVTPRESAVDAVVDIVILARTKRPPQGYIQAGEIDGLVICYKYGVIPSDFGKLPAPGQSSAPTRGAYPGLPGTVGQYQNGLPGQIESPAPIAPGHHTLRQASLNATASGIDGVPFELCPSLKAATSRPSVDSMDQLDTSLQHVEASLLNREYSYDFHVERSVTAV